MEIVSILFEMNHQTFIRIPEAVLPYLLSRISLVYLLFLIYT